MSSKPFFTRQKAVSDVLSAATDQNLADFDYWLEYIAVRLDKSHSLLMSHPNVDPTKPVHDVNGGSLVYKIPKPAPAALPPASPTRSSASKPPVAKPPPKAKPPTAAIFVCNWIQTWNSLVIKQTDDLFGDSNRLFKACCEFYFDVRIITFVSALTLYIFVLNIVELCIDTQNFELYVLTMVSNVVFIVAYVWGASIYKGELMQSSLNGEESRLAQEKISIMAAGGGSERLIAAHKQSHLTVKQERFYVGVNVYAKYFEDGAWLPATISGVHPRGDPYFDAYEQLPTYDVVYDRDGTSETAVKVRHIFLRPHSSTGKRELLRKMWAEVINTFRVLLFGPGPSSRSASHADARDSYVEFSGHSDGSSISLNPVVDASATAGAASRAVAENKESAAELEKARVRATSEVLRYYSALQQPIVCGYYEILDCVKKYSPDSSVSRGQSRLNKFATIFLAVVILTSPLINGFLWYLIFQERNSVHFLRSSCGTSTCHATFFFFVATGGYVLSCAQQILLYNGVFMVFVGLLYGCDAVHYLSKNWQLRYRGLRRINRVQRSITIKSQIGLPKNSDGDSESDNDTDSNRSQAGESEEPHLQPSTPEEKRQAQELERLLLLCPLIQRDAYERYLLLHHFTQQISRQWGAFLFCAIVLSLATTVLTYYLMVISGKINWIYVLALLVEALFFAYPVGCLGYANKHVHNILINFKITSPDDYAILGSRDKWTDFTEQAPLYWDILGVPITETVLTAYASTAGTVLPAIITTIALYAKDLRK